MRLEWIAFTARMHPGSPSKEEELQEVTVVGSPASGWAAAASFLKAVPMPDTEQGSPCALCTHAGHLLLPCCSEWPLGLSNNTHQASSSLLLAHIPCTSGLGDPQMWRLVYLRGSTNTQSSGPYRMQPPKGLPKCQALHAGTAQQGPSRRCSLDGPGPSTLLPPQAPFSLMLRFFDVYILEGEPMLTVMSYTALKIHRSKAYGAPSVGGQW